MSSAATKLSPSPRYGSPAEVARYAGLSVKSVRRLIAGGSVPASKVGRRVVIPFREVDRFIQERRAPVMASATTSVSQSPYRSVDARGRALPISAEEQRRRYEAAVRGFEEIAAMGSEEEQRATFEALVEGLNGPDALSSGKRFRECV